MPYKVTSPLVIVPNANRVNGDGYFYIDGIIPDGFNDQRCDQLVKDGMLAKVEASHDTADEKSNKVEDILAEVGDDKDLAAEALAAEQAKPKPRKSLVEKLQAVLDA